MLPILSTLTFLAFIASTSSDFLYDVAEGNFKAAIAFMNSKKFDKSILNEYDENGRTPAYVAIERGHVNLAIVLIQKGTDPNSEQRGKFGKERSIHAAVREQYSRCVKVLLEVGADPNLMDDLRQTALHVATNAGGNAKIIDLLVMRGKADLETEGPNEFTPLHAAIAKGNADAVEMLLRLGAKVNGKDSRGRSPLIHALCESRIKPEIVRSLVMHGADLNNDTDRLQRSPLALAASAKAPDIVKFLAERGAVHLGAGNAGNRERADGEIVEVTTLTINPADDIFDNFRDMPVNLAHREYTPPTMHEFVMARCCYTCCFCIHLCDIWTRAVLCCFVRSEEDHS